MAACNSEDILARPVIFTALRGACKAYPIRLMPAHCVDVNFADVPNT